MSRHRSRRAVSRIVLPLLLACCALFGRLVAQTPSAGDPPPELPPVYRVEVIVFLHEDGLSDRVRSAEPADFRDALAPALVADAVEAARFVLGHARHASGLAPEPDDADTPRPHLVAGDEGIEPPPWPYAAQPALSPPMQRALERLEGADAYRPLAWQAWFQRAEPFRPTATVRLHGAEVVGEVRVPSVAEALPFFPDSLTIPVFTDADQPPRLQPLFAPRPAMPLFRLDGNFRLFRRQFLHAAPTLVWHDPDTGLETSTDDRSDADISEPDGWLLHRLTQSRVVRPGRLEYFDSSRFGVLLRVTEFEHVVPPAPEPESEAEPNPESAPTAPAGADSSG